MGSVTLIYRKTLGISWQWGIKITPYCCTCSTTKTTATNIFFFASTIVREKR